MFLLKPSFAGGELSPTLYGRTDFAKYDNGAATLKNFLVLRYGGIANRAGTKYIDTLPSKAVLRPFKYNSNQNYIVAFYDHGIKIYQGESLKATVTNRSVPYSADELRLIKYTQSADVMYLVHPNHPPMTLIRKGDTNWVLEPFDIKGGPFEDTNTKDIQISASAKSGENITLTATADFFTDDMVGCMMRIGHTVGSQYKKGVPNASGIETATYTDIAKSGETTVLSPVPADYAAVEFTVTNKTYDTPHYTYNPVANTITIDPYGYEDDNGDSHTMSVSYTVTRKYNYATDNLQVECVPGGTVYVESFGFWEGNFSLEKYVDGQWTQVRSQNGNHSSNYNFTETNNHSEIISYRITSTEFDTTIWSGENSKQKGHVTIQTFSQDYDGIVKITRVVSGTSAKASVIKKLGDTKPSKDFSLSPWSQDKGYPCCANFFEDRLFLAGNITYGQSFWGSKSGDYPNFGTSIPGLDTDAVTGTLNGGQINGIKAMVAFGELIMLTAGGEHKVYGINKALSPSNMLSKAQEYRGISDVEPVTVGSRIVYIQQQGNIVRDLAYTYESDKYTGDDLNLLAGHLFERHKLVSMTYQQTPNSIVWFVREDGVLLGLTYLKEQDIFAWHQHYTGDQNDGFYDVATISGAAEDELWCVVKRHNGYCVEKMAERDKSDEVENQYFVDSGVQLDLEEPVSVVTGLTHLEGRTVSILADGFVLPKQTVENGEVYLASSYKKIAIGLPIESTLKTLPLELMAQDGSTISRKKRVAKLTLLFKESSGGRFGLNEDRLDEIKWRSNEPYNTAIKLYSGKQYILMPGATYNDTVQIVVKQTDPLPMTILSVIPEMQVSG